MLPDGQKDYHKMFWQVKMARQAGNDVNMSTGEALKILGEIIDNTGPHNPLRHQAVELQQDIIYQKQEFEHRAATNVFPFVGNALPTTATVLPFPSKKTQQPTTIPTNKG